LEIFVTNRPSLTESCEAINSVSNNEAVLTKSSIRVHLSHPVKWSIYLSSHADFSLFKQTSCEQFISTYSAVTPVNTLWDKFSAICAHGLSLIPTKLTLSKHHQPWITRHIKQLTRRKQWAYNYAHLYNLPGTSLCIMILKNNNNENITKLLTTTYPISLILKIIPLLKSYGYLSRVNKLMYFTI